MNWLGARAIALARGKNARVASPFAVRIVRLCATDGLIAPWGDVILGTAAKVVNAAPDDDELLRASEI